MSAHIPSSTDLHGARWRRSSRSTGMNNCVETAGLGDVHGHSDGDSRLLAVRDSKNTKGPALLFSSTAWTAFLGALREH
jgi:hypothetical protein